MSHVIVTKLFFHDLKLFPQLSLRTSPKLFGMVCGTGQIYTTMETANSSKIN